MRSILVLCALGALTLLLVGCSSDDGRVSAAEIVRSDAPRASAEAAPARDAAAAIEALAADLYLMLDRSGNLVFSPYSISIALAMTRAGAVGETARQMDAVLHAALARDLNAAFNALDQAIAERPGKYQVGDGTVELELGTANQLWGQRGFDFNKPFLDLLASQYGAGMMLVDYIEAREEARQTINRWVADQTRDRIPELIPDGVLDALTRLVLTNAIYLKAPWMHPFDEAATSTAPFYRLDGVAPRVPMMQVDARLRYGTGAGYKAVELPYAGGMLSMVVVVPDEGGFEAFEQRLNASLIRSVVASLGDASVKLSLPRFEFRSQAALKQALSDLGMPIAFMEDADFSGMSPEGRDMFIQDVIHEAFISVDEEGTEAAAATAVVVGIVSAPAVSAELKIDRPFLFLIRDNATGASLFMGRVVDPSA
jgi:serpin B